MKSTMAVHLVIYTTRIYYLPTKQSTN